jgi:hypothetical protein
VVRPTEDGPPVLPSVVQARLDALQSIVVEVADELDDRGVHDLAERLRGALP